MPHIKIDNELPGMASLAAYRPQVGELMQALAQQLLRGESELTSAEREMIAARVSAGNECKFCAGAHSATARELLDGDPQGVVGEVIAGGTCELLDERMRALMAIVDKVRGDAREVTDADIAAARSAGASDQAIHDAVAVAAAFSMYNRYVDGLGARTPPNDAAYGQIGQMLATAGYRMPTPR
jgi:uncharacterized peroxidase-related enzyme